MIDFNNLYFETFFFICLYFYAVDYYGILTFSCFFGIICLLKGARNMNYKKIEKSVIFRSNLRVISNIYDLKKLGAGHDGIVFQDGDKCLKLLKYDVGERREMGLMSFDKALYFQDELNLKRIEKPYDILFDSDGVYAGYVMRYLNDVTLESKRDQPFYRQPGDFTCGDLVYSAYDLSDDFDELTRKRVVAKDINRGSYIYTFDFLHLCDMDKYLYGVFGADDLNKKALNFTLAKLLYYEMLKCGNYNKSQLKMLSQWVKKSSNSRSFLPTLAEEVKHDYSTFIHEFAEYKVKTLLR